MPSPTSSLPDQARVVIIGAGCVGCSVAYHLTKMGWKDIVVLEQGPLFDTGGSTSHAPALIFQINASKMMSLLAKYTVELFQSLELEGQPCYYTVGGMEVAWTRERWQDLKRKVGFAKSWGLEAELISLSEAQEKVPIISDKILGAMYNPTDGLAKGVRVDEALAREAKGATFYANTQVTDIEVKNGHVEAVATPEGRIQTEIVVAAAGIWGPRIGRMAGISLPMQPVEHPQVKFGPLPELAGQTEEITHPGIRYQDRSSYCRQYFDYYEVGTYQHEPLLFDVDDILPYEQARVTPAIVPFKSQVFAEALISAEELIPCLSDAQMFEPLNGLFSFTPDGMPILGESPQVKGFWFAEAVWVAHAGGVGKVMAEWIIDGTPSIDIHEADISRLHPHVFNTGYIKTRSTQQYREVYDIIHPMQQMLEPRNLRVSPFNPRQRELGAEFFEAAGWERPQWYAANEKLLEDFDSPARSEWEARYWSPIVAAEHQATRERVAMFDQTPFHKLEVTGPKALEYLQSITSNQMDKPPGRITYTAMLNKQGRIKCDLTITRLEPQRFLVVTGGAFGIHDETWMWNHLPQDGGVHISNITSSMCCIGVWGPKSRELVQSLTDDNVSNEAFPYMTAQGVTIAGIPCLALRISYVGELGWEIYCPMEFGLRLWDALWEAGQPLGALAAGGGAFDSLRLEKGYRLWGAEIHTETNPYEAGLGFAVRLKKGDFLGREALEKFKAEGLSRKLCCITLDDPNMVVMGKEPILDSDKVLGYATSANYGYSVGRGIVYGYLPMEYASEGTKVEVEYFGQRYKATVSSEPLYDPEGAKLKS
ncbi:MAG: FAD-dependent oxidoreductase [Dehalococcoidia bacterium]